MFYVDTSALVALLADEPSHDRVRGWLRDRPTGIFISHWVSTELASALSRKVRMRQLSERGRSQVAEIWGRLRQSFNMLPIEEGHFRTAGELCSDPRVALRAGDALHIAIARDAGCSLITLDQRMAEAATALGFPVAAI